MTKKFMGILLSILLCLTCMPLNMAVFADDEYSDFAGSGTKSDPYQIDSYYKLALFAERINEITSEGTNEKYKNAYFIQTEDIEIPDDVNWTPIGTFRATDSNTNRFSFRGHYDGNYHSIKNLNCSSDYSYIGLFGRLGENGTDYTDLCVISNLSVYGNVSSSNSIVGGIAGELCAGAAIENCSFNGNVSGKESVGGIAGMTYNGGYIRNCYHNGTVKATDGGAGGIIGWLRVGNYEFSVNAGVYNSYHTGGMVVSNKGGSGGISGNVQYGEKNKDCKITLENNYYLSSACLGGVNGENFSGCNKLSDEFMKNVNELLGEPFVYNDDKDLNNGYPVFEWQSKPYQFKGSGTADDPYQISSKEELEKMRDLVNSTYFNPKYAHAHYIQTSDIDLLNELWTPIGLGHDGLNGLGEYNWQTRSFYGSYNGNYHSIKNLNVSGKWLYGGLFSYLRGKTGGVATISNLVVYGNINCQNCVYSGGIVGEMQYAAKIANCAFIGDIKANNNTGAGGIVGHIWAGGTITNSYHYGTVVSNDIAGGIAGSIDFGEANTDSDFTIISNCYHAGGSVTGKINDSIIGRCTRYEGINNDISVKNCYSIKYELPTTINGIFNTYEVIQLSENMMRNAYNELGEAFVKNPDINFNDGYPVFSWQAKNSGDVNGDGVFNVSDVVTFQKWLLAEKNVQLKNWKNADLCQDNRLDSFDLVIMKKQLIGK
ncbi:MAG: dockerin type I repeat-containing protein [Ruminococcus flavefaciens]|nr:dockerin type I repeat-containing protein [Ruminococcus flavefaciens]